MIRRKALIAALLIVCTTGVLTYSLHKPSDHEALSESPTTPTVTLVPPIDDIPKSAVIVKPLNPVKTEVKPSQPIKNVAVNLKSIEVEATFYVATCKGCSGITKTGDDVRKTIYVDKMRVIAVDPKLIPLRSIVRVTLADGTTFKALASDTGGAIKGKRIDVLVRSTKEAYALGRMGATVEILRKGDDDK